MFLAEHSETDTFDPEDDDEIQFKDTAGEDEDIEVRCKSRLNHVHVCSFMSCTRKQPHLPPPQVSEG